MGDGVTFAMRQLTSRARDENGPAVFARLTPTLCCMRQIVPRLSRVALEAGKDPKRSPLFHWLLKHHARLAPGLSRKRVDWHPVITAAATAGATDNTGAEPTVHTVRRTWRAVCQIVKVEDVALAVKPPRKLQPRDMPKDWRPVSISPPMPRPQQSLRELLGPVTSGPDLPEPDYTGMDDFERKIARMDWSIKKRSS